MSTPLSYFYTLAYLMVLLNGCSQGSFLFVWLFMEFSMFLFLGMIYSSEKSSLNNILNFFVIQSTSSLMILFTWFMGSSVLFLSMLFLKMAMFPFYFWFYVVSKNMNNMVFFFLSVPQKILPLVLLIEVGDTIPLMSLFLFAFLNLIIASLHMVNVNFMKDILIFSSISNNSWLILGSLASFKAVMVYLFLYSVSLYFVLSGRHMGFKITNMLSLSGLPPFPLFLSKLFIIFSLLPVFGLWAMLLVFSSMGIILGQVNYFIRNSIYKMRPTYLYL